MSDDKLVKYMQDPVAAILGVTIQRQYLRRSTQYITSVLLLLDSLVASKVLDRHPICPVPLCGWIYCPGSTAVSQKLIILAENVSEDPRMPTMCGICLGDSFDQVRAG